MTRRALLRDGGALAIAVFFARDAAAFADVAVAVGDEPAFLTAEELTTLRALVDRFVPGKPEDTDEGAVAAGCAEAIDALLGAFAADPPRIYAGAPFSDRGGSPVNHFEDFLALDPYEEKAWRLRIEGSRGRPDLEFNGPVKGWQVVYRAGLAALDAAAAPARFADLPGPARDAILRGSDDPAIEAIVDVGFPHTLELLYGAPEYGGNRELIGWDYTNYDGDVQPRGYTREQVEGDGDAPLDAPPAGVARDELVALAALASPELAHVMVGRSGGSLGSMRAELAPVREHLRKRRGVVEHGG